jgi:hypothetical protein
MENGPYTQREAAKRLRINPKALRRPVREGRLPELRLGPRLPVPLVLKFLATVSNS